MRGERRIVVYLSANKWFVTSSCLLYDQYPFVRFSLSWLVWSSVKVRLVHQLVFGNLKVKIRLEWLIPFFVAKVELTTSVEMTRSGQMCRCISSLTCNNHLTICRSYCYIHFGLFTNYSQFLLICYLATFNHAHVEQNDCTQQGYVWWSRPDAFFHRIRQLPFPFLQTTMSSIEKRETGRKLDTHGFLQSG